MHCLLWKRRVSSLKHNLCHKLYNRLIRTPGVIQMSREKYVGQMAIIGGLPKYTVDDVLSLAQERGGRMLSPLTDIRTINVISWQCAESHIWDAALRNILRGTWCPTCCSKKRERLARRILEFLYDASFWSCRPKWLKSPFSTQSLELDCLSEIRMIAAEIQVSVPNPEVGYNQICSKIMSLCS